MRRAKEPERFEIFHAYFTGDKKLSNEELQKKWHKTEKEIKNLIQITRDQFREHMCDIVRETVPDADIEDEVNKLFEYS